jgi:Tol biopolymer transport system component
MAGKWVPAGWPLVSAGLIAALALMLGAAPAEASPGITTRVSVTNAGEEADTGGLEADISGDGSVVAFRSSARNLTNDADPECFAQEGSTYVCTQIFVHDLNSATTDLVSTGNDGTAGNGNSMSPAVSEDGRFVAFVSDSDNLVTGDDNETCDDNADAKFDNCFDVFVHERSTGITERVSVTSDGTEAACPESNVSVSLPLPCVWEVDISDDGSVVVFTSSATNLVPGDDNEASDVFVHYRDSGVTERVSISSSGDQARGESEGASVSASGRFVGFASTASNLVPLDRGSYDAFVRDLEEGTTEMVSVNDDGEQGSDGSGAPTLSADGRIAAFDSVAPNFYEGDINCRATGNYLGCSDVFVRDRSTGKTVLAVRDATEAKISADGRFVAVVSRSAGLVPGDTNNSEDILSTVAKRRRSNVLASAVKVMKL